MMTAVGIIVTLLGLICWIGQSLAVFAEPTAIRFGLSEPADELDQSMYLFERFSQGIMDVLLAWILPFSAVLMLASHRFWPFFALVGGGVYLYFPGVFMITRSVLKRQGKSVGKPSSVMAAYVFGSIWTLSALTMILLAITELQA